MSNLVSRWIPNSEFRQIYLGKAPIWIDLVRIWPHQSASSEEKKAGLKATESFSLLLTVAAWCNSPQGWGSLSHVLYEPIRGLALLQTCSNSSKGIWLAKCSTYQPQKEFFFNVFFCVALFCHKYTRVIGCDLPQMFWRAGLNYYRLIVCGEPYESPKLNSQYNNCCLPLCYE